MRAPRACHSQRGRSWLYQCYGLWLHQPRAAPQCMTMTAVNTAAVPRQQDNKEGLRGRAVWLGCVPRLGRTWSGSGF